MNAKRGFCLKLVPLVSSLNRNPRLAEVLSLGLWMGLGAGLGWEPLGVVKQRKTPRQRDRGAGLTAKP